MPTSDAFNRTDRLQQIQLMFWRQPERQLRTIQIAEELGVNDDTIRHDLKSLSADGRLPVRKDGHFWRLVEGAKFELLPMKMNLPEAVTLYLAGRLLSLTHDKRNEHVLSALRKLVTAMPETIAQHQHALLDMTRERQKGQQDTSDTFEALALGWATHRKVRLLYTPPRQKTFECYFAPYLLEPSSIGRTIYAIGHSMPVNGLRIYKIERIEHAELTTELFEVPTDFDGPALLSKAWGVMYGDEKPVEVHLRFSHWVTKRLKETLWHPSQYIIDTADGCEWTAQIGDTLEIENWIRGWGADCEVLAPQELRKTMAQNARRLAHMYGVLQGPSTSSDDPDIGMLSRILKG